MRCTNPIRLKNRMDVPCGKCMQCRIGRTAEWTTRIIHELQGKDGVYITLTYAPEHEPEGRTLVKEDLQLFIKRLRKYLGERKIKYYACGEYGDEYERPHYHLIVIGWKADFKHCYKLGPKKIVSREIEKLWRFGFNTVGFPDVEAINYVTGYIRKKLYGKGKENRYHPRIAPFALQSLGMGLEYAKERQNQIFSERGITRNGRNVGLPRYYKKKLIEEGSKLEDQIRLKAIAKQNADMAHYGTEVKILHGDMNSLDNYHRARDNDNERRRLHDEARENLFKKGTL